MFKNVSLSGNLTRDPELQVFASGKQLCKMGVAVNDRIRNVETGEWTDGDTCFVDVIVFDKGSYIENVINSLRKGDKIVAEGTLRIRRWKRKDADGNELPDVPEGTSIELLADEIGPSLRFAQCTVTKVAKRNGGPQAEPAMEGDYNL